MGEVTNGNNSALKRDGRLAVDDLVIHCLHDDTFNVGMVPEQTGLPADRFQPKIMDRFKDDLAGDPYYRSLLVKVFPSDTPSEISAKNLAVIDRNLKIGQLVKWGPEKVGYVRSIQQTASARIYLPDETTRTDPTRELYIYKKPAEFYGKRPWKIDDVVMLNGWLGKITEITNNLTFMVDFKNGTQQEAHSTDVDFFKVLPNPYIPSGPENRERTARKDLEKALAFDINTIRGLFPDRTLNISYKLLITMPSLRWIGTPVNKPANSSESLVGITIKTSKLHIISVGWQKKVTETPPGTSELDGRPGELVKNEVDRQNLQLVSHSEGLKLGDVGTCNMTDEDWSHVMAKWTWQNTISKDYHLHRRRHKRQKFHEGSREILPAKPYPKKVSVEIVLTSTKAEVEWINAGIESNIDSRDLVPVRYSSAFPGVIYQDDERHRRTGTLVQTLGPGVYQPVRYMVLQSMHLTRVKVTYQYKNGIKPRCTGQEYQLAVGAVEPVPVGLPKEYDERMYGDRPPMVDQWRLWKNNCCQVVTKMPNSLADFTFGCVVGFFPDGRVRIKRQDGRIISVWPTDIVGLSKFPSNRYEQYIY